LLISTERLIVKKACLEDAPFIVSLWNNPDIMNNVGYPEGLNCTESDIRNQIAHQKGPGLLNQLLVVRKAASETLIGQAYMSVSENSNSSRTDIKLLPVYQGKRYGIEIKTALIQYIFEHTECHYVEATPNLANHPSIRMQESVGAFRIGRGLFKPSLNAPVVSKPVDYWIYRVYRDTPAYPDCRKRLHRYSAIIPVAGRSQRMQCFKPLLPWPPDSDSQYTVIESAVQALLNAGVDPLITVVGYRGDDIKQRLCGWPVRIVENMKPTEPMMTSVIKALPEIPSSSAVFIHPGDHPSVEPETISCLIGYHEQEPGSIHIPVYNGKSGHPALFPPNLLRKQAVFHLPNGLRSLIHSKRHAVVYHQVNDTGVLKNLDYPTDYVI